MIAVYLVVVVAVICGTGFLVYRSQDFRKFLAGAFFVSSGVLGYLYFTRTPVPLLGTDIVIQPGTHAVRAVIHGVLFAVCFYVGFLRRPRNGGA